MIWQNVYHVEVQKRITSITTEDMCVKIVWGNILHVLIVEGYSMQMTEKMEMRATGFVQIVHLNTNLFL